MINNLDKIIEKIEFSENEYCYNLSLVLRQKERNKLTVDNETQLWTNVSNKSIKNKDSLVESFYFFKKLADALNCRIYMSLHPIKYSVFAEKLKTRANCPDFSDQNLYDLYGKEHIEMSDDFKYYLIDIDSSELDKFNGIKEDIDLFHPDIFYVPTIDGYHIIGSPSEIKELSRKYSIENKCHSESKVLLYTPLERKAVI